MRNLRIGDTGADVMFAQLLHNNHDLTLRAPRLREDGVFGPRTQAAIQRFQTLALPALGPGGAIMPNTPLRPGVIDAETWRALGAGEAVEHGVSMIAQYNRNMCWHACMDMLLGGGRCRYLPAAMLDTSGGRNHGQLQVAALDQYATMLGGRKVAAPRTESALCDLIRSRPAVLTGTWVRAGGGHAVVLSGFYRNAACNDWATIVRVHNPWPVGIGAVQGSGYPFMELDGGAFNANWLIVR